MVEFISAKQKTGVLANRFYNSKQTEILFEIYNYANFLKQPLELGMFIPCDEDGNVIKSYYKDGIEHFDGIGIEELHEAEEKVLFDNCVYDEEMEVVRYGIGVDLFYTDGSIKENETIEDLVKYNLSLTESAIKTF